MILMHGWRLIIDAAFYLTFAMPICTHYGGNRGYLLALIPAAFYSIWAILNKAFPLSLDRQRRIFFAYCKSVPIFLGALLIGRSVDMVLAAIPWVIITLSLSVLLMRSLRHEPEIFLRWDFQILNWISLGMVCVAAYLVSGSYVLQGILWVLGGIYQSLILPILLLGIDLTGKAMSALGTLFPEFDGWESGTEVENIVSGAFETELDQNLLLGATQENGWILSILAGFVLLALVVFFFRWLAPKHKERDVWRVRISSSTVVSWIPDASPEKENIEHNSVRGIYRRFLHLCKKAGMEPEKHHTSQDIQQQAGKLFDAEDITTEIREIYIRHRYGGSTGKDDEQRIKILYREMKKK